MKIDVKDFWAPTGKKVKLSDWPTHIEPLYKSKKEYQELLAEQIEEMSDLQRLLYASSNHALLLVFQGMDASGKDGAIRHVMSGVNPQGCEVYSFKQPSAEELRHDFLWRTTCRLPERGRIGIFNRSYYEEVIVVKVHPELLLKEGIPAKEVKEKNFWKDRYHSIVSLEEHLYRCKTRVCKFFFHLSKEEQRKRLLARIDDPSKNWKFSLDDIKERKYWSDYTKAYEDCLEATSSYEAPWFIIPADDKENARLIVAHIIMKALRLLKQAYPKITQERKNELRMIHKILD